MNDCTVQRIVRWSELFIPAVDSLTEIASKFSRNREIGADRPCRQRLAHYLKHGVENCREVPGLLAVSEHGPSLREVR